MPLDLSKLTDEEVAFLTYAAEHEYDSDRKSNSENEANENTEEMYTETFMEAAELIMNALEKEYRDRWLGYGQFYKINRQG